MILNGTYLHDFHESLLTLEEILDHESAKDAFSKEICKDAQIFAFRKSVAILMRLLQDFFNQENEEVEEFDFEQLEAVMTALFEADIINEEQFMTFGQLFAATSMLTFDKELLQPDEQENYNEAVQRIPEFTQLMDEFYDTLTENSSEIDEDEEEEDAHDA